MTEGTEIEPQVQFETIDLEKGHRNGNAHQENEEPEAIPLEEALTEAGDGLYLYLVSFVAGLVLFSTLNSILAMSYVVPVAESDLSLTPFTRGLLTSMSFTGMIFSSHLFGFLSDWYGRRRIVLICSFLSAVVCILASLCPEAVSLSIFWFMNGFLISGIATPIYVYVSEFSPFSLRSRALLLCAAFGSLASTFLPCIAWVILPLRFELTLWQGLVLRPWRLLIAYCAVPTTISAISLSFFPESPKFTLANGDHDVTLETIKTMYAMNKRAHREQFPIKRIVLDKEDVGNASAKANGNSLLDFVKSMWRLTFDLFRPKLLKYTLVSCATQFGIIGAYNMIMLWLPEVVNKIVTYNKQVRGYYEETICEILMPHVTLPNGGNILPDLDKETLPTYMPTAIDHQIENVSAISEEVFMVNVVVGILQFLTFGFSSTVSQYVGRKNLIVTCLLISAGTCFSITLARDMYLSIICMTSIVVLVGAALPIAMSIVVDFFPTYLRSTATCICMVFGRIGSASGGQLFGLMLETNCDLSYYLLSGFLVLVAILCMTIPLKRIELPNEEEKEHK